MKPIVRVVTLACVAFRCKAAVNDVNASLGSARGWQYLELKSKVLHKIPGENTYAR